MTYSIDNSQDVIDSRDIIDRIEELEGLSTEEGWTVEDNDELDTLKKVAEQAENYGDWGYGETLIRESYFTDYIEELIADCYEMPKDMTSGNWPWRHMKIDYEAAAEEAKVDYTTIDFDGVTYLMRA